MWHRRTDNQLSLLVARRLRRQTLERESIYCAFRCVVNVDCRTCAPPDRRPSSVTLHAHIIIRFEVVIHIVLRSSYLFYFILQHTNRLLQNNVQCLQHVTNAYEKVLTVSDMHAIIVSQSTKDLL